MEAQETGFYTTIETRPGLIFSIIGYNEVKNSNGMKTGGGLALAGIIISIANILLGIMIMASK